MGNVLLVKLMDYACLFRVCKLYERPFKAWVDKYGVDLYWKGRRVEKVYAKSATGDCWWSVPITSAIRSLTKNGFAVNVDRQPDPEGDLPL